MGDRLSDGRPTGERLFRELVTMLSWSRKHVQHEVEGRWQVEAFRRVAEVAGGDPATRPRLSIVCCTASPLRAHAELLDASSDVAAMGFPVVVLPMPIAGAAAPTTVAGTATVNVAEFLGAATAIRLAAPDAKVIMGVGAALLDMRETTFSFGAVETGLAAATCVEVAHDLGVPCLRRRSRQMPSIRASRRPMRRRSRGSPSRAPGRTS